MMTLPGIDSFVPRRFLPAACAKMVKDPPRLHDSSVTNTRGSQTKDVCELHAPFRPRILPQLSVRALKKNRFCQNQKKSKAVFTVHILSTACRVYQPNALPKRIVCLEDGRHVKSVYSKVRCISSEKNKHFHICFMKVSRKTNERERDETSFRYDLRSLRSRVDCALFSNPLDLLSQIKKYFPGVIIVFTFWKSPKLPLAKGVSVKVTWSRPFF